jgi:hypothetical protein
MSAALWRMSAARFRKVNECNGDVTPVDNRYALRFEEIAEGIKFPALSRPEKQDKDGAL